jgi:sporulation protein YlmC with PRC-barrel domain
MRNYLITGALALALAAVALSPGVSAQATQKAAAIPFVTKQPANEWLTRVFIGASVQNPSGDIIGNINDLVFDHSGQISTVVLGVGGVLGMGEKNVGIPYSVLSFKTGPAGARIIVVALTKAELKTAPIFVAIEKTNYDVMKDKAIEIGKQTSEKAVELKDQAVKKYEDMKADKTTKQ